MTFYKLKRLLAHLWFDVSDAQRAIPPDLLQRLAARVAASEQRHSGQIRICVEAALPMSYLWRLGPKHTMDQLVRQRALMLFGKLRVWDTAHNNGVLVYVQLAEHGIEIVADRGLMYHMDAAQWQAMVARMTNAFQQKRYEDGLMQALEESSALLMTHFARTGASPGQLNELPDTPMLQ